MTTNELSWECCCCTANMGGMYDHEGATYCEDCIEAVTSTEEASE